MAIDFSFLENAAPKQPEPEPVKQESGVANVSIRVDADCMMQCDGEYVDIPLKADMMAKTQLPIGQHLLEFFSKENPNIKVEKIVEFPESDKNYLVMVNELKMMVAASVPPPMPQMPQMPEEPQIQTPPENPFLNQLTNMSQNFNAHFAAQQMNMQMPPLGQQANMQMPPLGQQTPPPFPPPLETNK